MSDNRRYRPLRTGGALLLAAVVLAVSVNTSDSIFIKTYLLLAGAALLVVWMKWIVLAEGAWSLSAGEAAMLAYPAVSALSFIAAVRPAAGLEPFALLLAVACMAIVAARAYQGEGERFFLAVTVVTAAAALVAAAGEIPGLLPVRVLESAERQTTSTFGNSSYFAGFLVMALPIVIAWALGRRRFSALQIAGLILALAVVVLIIRTETRSAWGGAAAGLVVLAIAARRLRGAVAGVAAAALIAGILLFPTLIESRIGASLSGSPTSSIARRTVFYHGAWNAFLSSPIIGNGVGNFPIFLPKFRAADYWVARAEDIVPHAHNEFLEVLSETGIAGCAAFLLVLVLLASAARRALRERPGDLVAAGCAAALAGGLVDNLSSVSLRIAPDALLFWMTAGVLLGCAGNPAGPQWRMTIPAALRPLRFALPVMLAAGLWLYGSTFPARYASEKEFLEGSALRWEKKPSVDRFRNVLALNPGHGEARIYLAADLLQAGAFLPAKRETDTLLNYYPYYPKAKLIAALADFGLGDTAAAVAEISAEMALEHAPQVLFTAGQIAARSGKLGEAASRYDELIASGVRAGRNDYVAQTLHEATVSHIDLKERYAEVGRTFAPDAAVMGRLAEAYVAAGKRSEARGVLAGMRLRFGAAPDILRWVTAMEDSLGK